MKSTVEVFFDSRAKSTVEVFFDSRAKSTVEVLFDSRAKSTVEVLFDSRATKGTLAIHSPQLAQGLPPQTLVQVSGLELHISLSLTGVNNVTRLLSSETK